MFEYLKERFGLDEQLFERLSNNEDHKELLKDYETIYKQSQEFDKDTEQYSYYRGLLFELEEEIVDLILSVGENEI